MRRLIHAAAIWLLTFGFVIAPAVLQAIGFLKD